jgi:hypothetical protein
MTDTSNPPEDLVKSLANLLKGLSPSQQDRVDDVLRETGMLKSPPRLWKPNSGVQELAFYSEADEIFYGGAAGCGKTSLLVGTALANHQRSVIFRKHYKEVEGLILETENILGGKDGYNGQEKNWSLGPGRSLEFGSLQYEDDKEKWRGRAHDLKGFDEICHFSETQYRFITSWLRPAPGTDPTQRCRIICTGNPPENAEGRWVIRHWGAWLDPQHPNPAKHGELRWYTTIAGVDTEVDGPGPHLINGEMVGARSRTFIGGRVSDNPHIQKSYIDRLMAEPEPRRSMLLYGRFDVGIDDDEWQVIPTTWVQQAQNRWEPDGWKKNQMTAIGVDVAQGGSDKTVLAPRHLFWYAPLVVRRGSDTPDFTHVVGLIAGIQKNNAAVVVDVGGGYGGPVVACLKENQSNAIGFNGAASSSKRSTDKQLKFKNKRAEAYWTFREALDPGQEGGSPIALPPDPEILIDLCAARWKMTTSGEIQIQLKDEIKKAIGRSPDKADAIIMAWGEGQNHLTRAARRGAFWQSANAPNVASYVGSAAEQGFAGHRTPQVIRGYPHLKRH